MFDGLDKVRDVPLLSQDVWLELQTFTQRKVPPPPQLPMPEYSEDEMPWAVRKQLSTLNPHAAPSAVKIPSHWGSYEECLTELRKRSYVNLYYSELPGYYDNLRYKIATKSFCRAFQTALNETYARHMLLCELSAKPEGSRRAYLEQLGRTKDGAFRVVDESEDQYVDENELFGEDSAVNDDAMSDRQVESPEGSPWRDYN